MRTRPSFTSFVSSTGLAAYGGATAYFWSELPNGAFPSEWRLGGELLAARCLALARFGT